MVSRNVFARICPSVGEIYLECKFLHARFIDKCDTVTIDKAIIETWVFLHVFKRTAKKSKLTEKYNYEIIYIQKNQKAFGNKGRETHLFKYWEGNKQIEKQISQLQQSSHSD